MKKLITVTWSRTIEVALPVETNLDTIQEDIKSSLIARAYLEISEQDGEITDIQDI